MSYASEVKKELTTLEVHFGNAKAELMALIRMNGSLGLSNHRFILNVQTENHRPQNLQFAETVL